MMYERRQTAGDGKSSQYTWRAKIGIIKDDRYFNSNTNK